MKLVIDSPSEGSTVEPWVVVSGWVVGVEPPGNESQGIRAVRLSLGSRTCGPLLAEAPVGIARPDVVARLALDSRYEFCGFETNRLGLPPGPRSLSISAIGDDGRVLTTHVLRLHVEETNGPNRTWPCGDPGLRAFATREEPSAVDLADQRKKAADLGVRPRFDIVTDASGADLGAFRRTARSVVDQTWPDWRWIVSCDHEQVSESLTDLAGSDSRVRRADPARREHGSRSSDDVWLVPLEPGDALSPDALYHFATAARVHPKALLLTADGDRIDEEGRRFSPTVAPQTWNLALTLCEDPTRNLCAFRSSAVAAIGGFDGTSMSLDSWSCALRLVTATEEAAHVSRLLIHRPLGRQGPPLPRAAIEQVLRRSDIEARIEASSSHRVTALWSRPGGHLTTIVIPTRDAHLAGRCLASLLDITVAENFEVVVAVTGDDDAWHRTRRLREAWTRPAVRFEMCPDPSDGFNFHVVCNLGARGARGDSLLFLNDDVEIVQGTWLNRMTQWLAISDVGCVGAKLLDPGGTIQHAGVAVGIGGFASHLYRGMRERASSVFAGDDLYRECSAVTAACCLVRRSAFEEVGGFDEGYRLNFGDVDMCLRLRNSGHRIVYTPDARLIHRESSSRVVGGRSSIPRSDWERFAGRWLGLLLRGDPCLSPLLSVLGEIPRLRTGPRDNAADQCDAWMHRLPESDLVVLPDDMVNR